MSEMNDALEKATEIAIEAAALVSQYHGGKVIVERKEGNEPVTIADREASELIVARLRQAFPDDAILSEEMPDDGSRLKKRRAWMIDPIDGTSDFIRGEDGYAVMIGMNVDGRPRVGVVAQPPTQKVYGGIVGDEAKDNQSWLQIAGGPRAPLKTSSLAALSGIRLVASKSHRSGEIDQVRKALGIEDEMNIGGVGLKLGLIAEAVRDLYVYPGDKTKLWDACAPEAILIAAGGRLSDRNGDPVDYMGQKLFNAKGLVASNGALHKKVIDRLAAEVWSG